MRQILNVFAVRIWTKPLLSPVNVTSQYYRRRTPFTKYTTFVNKPKKNTIKLDTSTLDLLSTLSLVDFADETHVSNLESAIEFANQLLDVNVGDDVEPMHSVLENSSLLLREDEVTVPNCRDQLLRNASKSEEEYFVTPIGNVPTRP